jgi:RNA recognition motif-containing protein
VFDTKESRERAVTELSGQHLGGRYLTIQQPKKPREDTTQGAASQRTAREQPEDCKVVYVKNLPYDASEQDIWDTFHVCGKIVEGGVRIARNYQTQQSKGFAYIEFKNPEGAYSAVQKAAKPFGMTVHGRPCFVDYDEGAMKGSYKTKEGRLWTREYGKKPTTTTTNKRPRPTL